MLVRAARRTARPILIRKNATSEQLYLPWLCPAYNAIRRDLRRITVDTPSPALDSRKRRYSNDGSKVSSRSMATTTTGSAFDDIPFVGLNDHFPVSANSNTGSLAHLRPLNPPLMLGGSLVMPDQRLRMEHTTGVTGTFPELLSIFRACLQVGRIDRAKTILKRIQRFLDVTPEDAVELHNEYLDAAVSQLLWRPSGSAAQDLHKWFELEIRGNGHPLTAETIGYMVKASLQSLDDDRKRRLVGRYMDIAHQRDCALEVLALGIFSGEDLNQITQICPDYNADYQKDKGDHELRDEVHNETAQDMPEPATFARSTAIPPEVRPMPQKGLGLKALKQALALFAENEEAGINTGFTVEQRREAQRRLETNAVDSAVERWREENSQLKRLGYDTHLQTKSMGARMFKWSTDLKEALDRELDKVDESEMREPKHTNDHDRCQYGPFIRLLPTEKLAAITILSVMGFTAQGGVAKSIPLSGVLLKIADNVEDEILFRVVESKNKKSAWGASMKSAQKNRLIAAQLKRTKRGHVLRSVAKSNEDDSGETTATYYPDNPIREALAEAAWPAGIKAKVGACLLSAFMEIAKVPVTLEHPETKELVTQMQPALQHSYRFSNGKKVGVVICNKVLVRQMNREPVHSLLAKHLPMLVQPEPWTEFSKGGFLCQPAKVMRIKNGDKDQRHYIEAAISEGDMEQTFKGLDVLGRTPWRINQPVFDVMLEAWNTGEAIANLAPESPIFEIPPEPQNNSSQDPFERLRWLRSIKAMENTRKGLHSQRCFQNFQLEIARSFRNETFYFPHNVDFRGRAYPLPPYLNHIGADHCRGLLMFGTGKPLGKTGLRWLKIHLANVYGYDKASLTERENFAAQNITEIYDSASKPLDGNRWWLTAEDQWQFLAACMELKNALDTPDPTKFVSRLPVHQDGTCNGLQHYAALGGDEWGARQVNLEPGDRPSDVYSGVAELVKESIAADKKAGVEIAQVLDGRITRKIVKRTVMTNVYGVTFMGAKAQVRGALNEQYDDLPKEPHLHPGILASYVTRKIFTALSSMFQGAHDIQFWLGECASLVSVSYTPEQMDRWEREADSTTLSKVPNLDDSKVLLSNFKSSVIWTTPLHMPVVQPYRTIKSTVFKTTLQDVHISEPHRSNPINKRKQLQAFPPNFIHSLDATHMLLSALACNEKGLTFAAVHDSFWTHACDLDTMNDVLRDTFIRIHEEDVMGRLSAEFRTRYKAHMYLAMIREGTPLYKSIIAFRKENKVKGEKNRRMKELQAERKRLRLLASTDPDEVEEGKQMITAGSLFEQLAAKGDILPQDDVVDAPLLGDIPESAIMQHGNEVDLNALSQGVDGSKMTGLFDDGNMDAEVNGGDVTIADEGNLKANEDEDCSSWVSLPFEPRVKPKGPKVVRSTWVWLPLNFPPVPKKVRVHTSR
jgi:DNA-directed RNA polymerase